MDVHAAHIAQIHQQIGYVLKVGPSTVPRRIDPLYHLGIAPAGNPGLHTGRIVSGPRGLVVEQLDVVYPAVNHGNDELFQIQPEIVPVVRLLAHKVRRTGLVQPGVYLGAAIARN